MNSTVYIFGRFNAGYTQYPDDYTRKLFPIFYEKAKAATQVMVHRNDDAMYYAYIRKLGQDRYIGFCVQLSRMMLNKPKELFPLFENVITRIIENGRLIGFNESGAILPRAEKLYLAPDEIERITFILKKRFDSWNNDSCPLPPSNFSVVKNSVKEFTIEDNQGDIFKSTYTNGYTFIYKSKDYNTATLNSYKGILASLDKKNRELSDNNKKLEEELIKIKRTKKQFRNVLVLFLLLVVFGAAAYVLYNDLNKANRDISDKNLQITKKDSLIEQNLNSLAYNQIVIDSLDGRVYVLNNDIYNTRHELSRVRQKAKETKDSLVTCVDSLNGLVDESERKLAKARKELKETKDMLLSSAPFAFRSGRFDFATGKYTLSYHGFINGNVEVLIKVKRHEDGTVWNHIRTMAVSGGENSCSFYIDKNHDRSKKYTFEVCLITGSSRH